MHGSKTRSRDFITRPETEFYARTLAGAPTTIHIKYWNTYNIFHGYFDLKPIYSKYFHVSHVPTRIGTQPSHRHAASQFELRGVLKIRVHTASYQSTVYFIYSTMALTRWLRLRRSVKISLVIHLSNLNIYSNFNLFLFLS